MDSFVFIVVTFKSFKNTSYQIPSQDVQQLNYLTMCTLRPNSVDLAFYLIKSTEFSTSNLISIVEFTMSLKRQKPANHQFYRLLLCFEILVAEREGFEPPVPCSTTVFKTAAFDHSAISPDTI